MTSYDFIKNGLDIKLICSKCGSVLKISENSEDNEARMNGCRMELQLTVYPCDCHKK